MKRNCNLELRLVTPSVFYRPDYVKGEYNSMSDMEGDGPNEKQLSIFSNGGIACDATQLQARAIIWLASREMEDEWGKQFGSNPVSPLLISLGYSPTMKRSLERFLQKRKSRAQATSPYTIPRPT